MPNSKFVKSEPNRAKPRELGGPLRSGAPPGANKNTRLGPNHGGPSGVFWPKPGIFIFIRRGSLWVTIPVRKNPVALAPQGSLSPGLWC
jgi:hypothetical protein